jgi:hypothetical protein
MLKEKIRFFNVTPPTSPYLKGRKDWGIANIISQRNIVPSGLSQKEKINCDTVSESGGQVLVNVAGATVRSPLLPAEDKRKGLVVDPLPQCLSSEALDINLHLGFSAGRPDREP